MCAAGGLYGAEPGSGAVQSKVVPHDAVCVTGGQEWPWLTGGEFPQAKAHLFLTTPIYRTLEEIVF